MSSTAPRNPMIIVAGRVVAGNSGNPSEHVIIEARSRNLKSN